MYMMYSTSTSIHLQITNLRVATLYFGPDQRASISPATRNRRHASHWSQRGSYEALRHRARVARENTQPKRCYTPTAHAECPSHCDDP